MAREYFAVSTLEARGLFVSRVKIALAIFVILLLLITVVTLGVLLAHEKRKDRSYETRDERRIGEEELSLTPIFCDVVVVGGGISGMYMAETLMRMKKEDNVCLFEKDSRFGGRNFDFRFSQAPNISISLGAWRVDKKHKTVMDLARRFNIPMFKMDGIRLAYVETRGFYASDLQSLKEQAFPSLLSGEFANMTPSEMSQSAWMNMTREKALEFLSYRDFMCQRLGSEGCEYTRSSFAIKVDYNMEESTLFTYEHNKAKKYFSYEFLRPFGGLSEITTALEKSARRFGVKMYLNEKVEALNRKGSSFAVQTENFSVLAKKLVIAVPTFPFEKITGDVAAEIKSNYLFKSILARPSFKAAAVYSYPWWENTASSQNITLKPFEMFVSGSNCLAAMMPYSGRGPHGEAVIQLSYSLYGCSVKWGQFSKLPKEVFESELKKAVQEVFPGMVVPEPLDVVFKYWDNTCWHQTKAGSNASRYDLEEWAKRPFPGEEVFLVGEAFSIIDAWNEGALLSAYKALKEGWEIMQPEP